MSAKRSDPTIKLLRASSYGLKGETIRWDDIHYEEALALVDIGAAELIKSKSRKVSIEDPDSRKRIVQMDGWVFDPDEVFRRVLFPFCKLADGEYAYGVVLARNTDELDRQGRPTGEKVQVWYPVLITSGGELLAARDRSLKRRKVTVVNAPEEPESYPMRWSLPSIEKYLRGEAESIEVRELFNRVRGLYEEFLYFSPSYWYDIHALWDMMTYCFLLFHYIPILELRGMSGTAKTKIMTVSRQISFNPTEEMTNPSASTLFRETHFRRPTKYIDEAERLFPIVRGKVEPDERAELVNSSYKSTGAVPRQEKIGNRFTTVNYSTYSPTMIGSIQGLHGATESRAIVHVTQKNRPGDPRANREPNPEDRRFQQVRDDLYIFTLQNADEIKRRYDAYDDPAAEGREAYLLKPLLVLAQMVGDDLHDRVLPVLVSLLEKRSMNAIGEGSWEYAILKAVRDIVLDGFYDHPERSILVKTIVARMDVEGERKPASKSVTNILDKFGFLDLKDRWSDGTGYRNVTIDFIGAILTAQCPELVNERMRSEDYTSSSSSSSSSDDNTNEENAESVKKMKNANEENADYEVNEGVSIREAVSACDSGDGASFADLQSRGVSDSAIEKAKERGSIYEFKAGRFKVLL